MSLPVYVSPQRDNKNKDVLYRLYVTIHSLQLKFQFQFHANGIYWWYYGTQFNWSYMSRSYGDLFRDEKLEVGVLGWFYFILRTSVISK
jgi:hypothetical protein